LAVAVGAAVVVAAAGAAVVVAASGAAVLVAAVEAAGVAAAEGAAVVLEEGSSNEKVGSSKHFMPGPVLFIKL
jgi:hypothetical protein